MALLGQFERASAGKAYPIAFGLGDVDQASTIRPAVPDGLYAVDEWNRRITSKDKEASDILEQNKVRFILNCFASMMKGLGIELEY
jgi:hypothetical protein